MLKSNRYIIISIIVGLVAVTALIVLYRQISYSSLVKHETLSNVTLAQTFANSIWPHYAQSMMGASTSSSKTETTNLRQEVLLQMHRTRVLAIKIYNPDGLVVFSTDNSQIGQDKHLNAGFISARSGHPKSNITFRNRFDSFDGVIVDRNLVSSYVPIYSGETSDVTAVFEVYSDVTELVGSLEQIQWYIILGVVGSLSFLYIVLFLIASRADQTIRKHEQLNVEQEVKFNFHAYHDPLTSLPNRSSFVKQVKESVERTQRARQVLGVLLLDLDNFKLINDSFGHVTGDHVVRVVSKRLMSAVRETDSLFRIGGDEFAVILENLEEPEGAVQLANKIIEIMTKPIGVNMQSVIVTTSIGISIYPRDANNAELLVKNADAALHMSKESGRNRYKFYSPEMNQRALEQLALESDLQQALQKDEFFLYYQPRLSGNDYRIVASEALVRWRHPELGLLSSEEFVPILERIGAIENIGEWALVNACRQNKAWQDQGLPPIRVSVNISYFQVRSGHLVKTVREVLERTGLPAEYLELELTESILIDNTDAVIDTFNQLKDVGVYISIDDFGAGYSSLNYLRRLPINFIKMDRIFIQEIQTNTKDAAIVGAIFNLAHGLGIQVVAEGIEVQQQEDILLQHRCDELQGFLYSPAVPAEKFGEMVANSPFPNKTSADSNIKLVHSGKDSSSIH